MPLVPAATGHRVGGGQASTSTTYKAPTVSVRSPPTRNAAPRLTRGDSDSHSNVGHTGSSGRSSLGVSDPYKRPPSAASSHGGSVVSHSSVRTDGPVHSHGQHPVRPKSTHDSGPMFFHASDAKPSPRQHTKPPVSSAKFFYAGSTPQVPAKTPASKNTTAVKTPLAKTPITPKAPGSTRTPVLKQRPKLDLTPITAPQYPALAPSLVSPVSPVRDSKESRENRDSRDSRERNVKFVYANGTEEVMGPKNGSSRSVSPHQMSPTGISASPPSRPSSHHPAQALAHHHPHQPAAHSAATPQPQLSRQNSVSNRQRRPSIDMSATTPTQRHGRAVSIGSYADIKTHLTQDYINCQPHANGSHAAEAPLSPKSPPSAPFSPKISTVSVIEQQKELAAAARRERKVLDLEISNASLLAINKTLEKRMRKQMSELRRFRRLSRSGRLSLVVKKSRRRDPDTETELDEFYDANDDEEDTKRSSNKRSSEEDEDEDEEEEEEEEEEDDDDDSGEAETPKDGTEENDTTKDHITARRVKDEKRLASDIAKHQALLDASAKMNASLKRCQFVTEALIEEGKKALSYIVRPSEVKLGGRVLIHADDSTFETETEDGHGYDDDEDGYSTPTYQESDAPHSDTDGHSIYSQSDTTSNDDDDKLVNSDHEEHTM